MVLRSKQDIVFSLTGDEGIIDYKIKYTIYLVVVCKKYEWKLEEILPPYNFILANSILRGYDIRTFDEKNFQSIYHIDEYILKQEDPIPLMLKLIELISKY